MTTLPPAVLSKQFKSAEITIASMDVFFKEYYRTGEALYMGTFICNWWNYNKSYKAIQRLADLVDIQRSLERNYKKALVDKDTKEMSRYVLMWLISLANQKEDIIRAFTYDPTKGKFNRKNGINVWNEITKDLIIPELKSVGIPPKE